MIKEALKYQKKIKTSQEKGFCKVRSKEIAFSNPYIQANPLNSYEWIIVDCDYDVPYFKDLPVCPNYLVRNKDNNRAHLYFKISAVHNNDTSSYRAIEYYHAVRIALTLLLKGDTSFTQTLSKNPLATDYWRVEHIHSDEYDLSELAENCDLMPKYKLKELKKAQNIADITGRNQSIFDSTRMQAYRLKNPKQEQIEIIAESFNQKLDNPLEPQEIGHIAKSIWKYVSKQRNIEHSTQFIDKQRKKGLKSGKKRAENAQKVKDKAFVALSNVQLTLKQIADKLGVSERTIQKIKACFANTKRTKSGSPRPEGFGGKLQIEVDEYLVETFKLYSETENSLKIPLLTILRLLE